MNEPRPHETLTDLVLLGLAALFFFTVGLGARDLWNPNEPIYGRVVVEMAESGEWLVPTRNGEVFGEKPILYYWMALIAAKLVGSIDEFSLRLPASGAAILSVLLTYLLVLPYTSRSRARLASLLLSTLYLVWWTARTIQMDGFVMAATLGALVPLSRMLDHGMSGRKAWALAGLAVGLGFVGKGPVAIVVPGLVFLGYVVATRRPVAQWLPSMPWGFLTGFVAGGPWYVALWLSGEYEVLEEVLVRQNFSRFVAAWDHVKPWWYYTVYFLSDYLPWSWIAPISIGLPDLTDKEKRLHRLAWVWIIVVIVFFSLSESKRAPYLLPIAPAIVILASSVVARFAAGKLQGRSKIACLAVFATLGTITVALSIFVVGQVVGGQPTSMLLPVQAVALLLLAVGLAIWVGTVLHRRHPVLAPASLAGGFFAIYLAGAVWVLPAGNELKSMKGFVEEALENRAPGSVLASFQIPYRRSGLVYYAAERIEELDEEADLVRFCSAYTPGSILFVESDGLDRLTEIVGPLTPALERSVGSRIVYAFPSESVCGQLGFPSARSEAQTDEVSDRVPGTTVGGSEGTL